PIAPLTPPFAPPGPEMNAAHDEAPLLPAIEPATVNPPDKPASPAPKEASAASLLKTVASDAVFPIAPLTPPSAPPGPEMKMAQDEAPHLPAIEPTTANPAD